MSVEGGHVEKSTRSRGRGTTEERRGAGSGWADPSLLERAKEGRVEGDRPHCLLTTTSLPSSR